MLVNHCRRAGVKALATVACIMSIGATANAQVLEVSSYRIEAEDCPGCSKPYLSSETEVRDYMESMRQLASDGKGFGSIYGFFKNRRNADKQVVFVDFDAGGDPTFAVCNSDGTVFGIFNDHVYTKQERQAILARIRYDYRKFNFKITDKEPTDGEYTTLFLGQNDVPVSEDGQFCLGPSNITVFPGGGLSILFGQAEGIDFRNQNMSDNAFADASFWEFLAQLDALNAEAGFPTNNFGALSGISPDDFGGDITAAVSFAVTNQSSNTGAHEVGHLLGLRHQNSFGPPGSGLPDTFAVFPEDFVPVFELPDGDFPFQADETILHTMASGASVGLPLTGSTITDRFFSERSAVRLAFNERGRVKDEQSVRRWGNDFVPLLPLRTQAGAQQIMLFAEPLAHERRTEPLDARPLTGGADPLAARAEMRAPTQAAATNTVNDLRVLANAAARDAETMERVGATGDRLSDTARTAADLASMAEAFRTLPPKRYLDQVADHLEQRLLDAPNTPNAPAYRALLAKARAGRDTARPGAAQRSG